MEVFDSVWDFHLFVGWKRSDLKFNHAIVNEVKHNHFDAKQDGEHNQFVYLAEHAVFEFIHDILGHRMVVRQKEVLHLLDVFQFDVQNQMFDGHHRFVFVFHEQLFGDRPIHAISVSGRLQKTHVSVFYTNVRDCPLIVQL